MWPLLPGKVLNHCIQHNKCCPVEPLSISSTIVPHAVVPLTKGLYDKNVITSPNSNLETLVPDNPNRPYDMVQVIEEVVDDGIFMELFTLYAENIIIGFARLDGKPVGIIAMGLFLFIKSRA